jgi:hypothetical protein
MCTLSLSPEDSGFFLVMNRDEQRSRVTAHPPRPRRLGERTVLHPSEPGGGTWIGINDSGTVFALLNWYSVPVRPLTQLRSRGTIVPALLTESDPHRAGHRLAALGLELFQPFRVVGIFPSEASGAIREWRWNGASLVARDHPWKLGHWISSGADEPGAERERRLCFQRHASAPDHGTLTWLERLHASHEPDAGCYSICVHRDDAVTVSQTRIHWSRGTGWMEYLAGSPCSNARPSHRIPWPGTAFPIAAPSALNPHESRNRADPSSSHVRKILSPEPQDPSVIPASVSGVIRTWTETGGAVGSAGGG